MHLDLADDEAAALTQELHDIFESDRYPFSARIRTLRAILAKLPAGAGPRALAAAEDICAATVVDDAREAARAVKPKPRVPKYTLALVVACLAMLLAGCGANANAGPNPGGGFLYGAEHGDNGSINP